jgi:hypothetical protein
MTTSWQPINTAPKDNKRPLYLARIDKEGKLIEIDFDGAWELWTESWEMPTIKGYCWCSARGIEEPTHWAYQDEPIPSELTAKTIVERDIAISMLAAWCVAIKHNGAGWDDWDEHYKDALYRENPIRELLDTAIKEEEKLCGIKDE